MASGSLSGSTGSLGPTAAIPGSNIVTLTGGSSGALHSEGKGIEISREDWVTRLEAQHLARADMNKLIMNYLVTEGFKEAAEKFQKESGVESSVDLDSLDLRIKIKDLIQQGRIQESIALVNDFHPELLDNDRYLYFHLQQQQLIELIRDKQIEQALEFAQIHLAERGEDEGLAAPRNCFSVPPPSPLRNFFKVGNKLEAVDKRNPQLLCPATIKRVRNGGKRVTVGFDGFSETYDYTCNYKDRDLFPINWHFKTGDSLESAGPLGFTLN